MGDRRQRRFEELHERLIRAGIRLHGGSDVGDITVADIAEEADVALATFYNHFDSLEAFRHKIEEVQTDHVQGFASQSFASGPDLATAMTMWLSGLWRGTREFPDDLRHALQFRSGTAGQWTPVEEEIRRTLASSTVDRPQPDDELAAVAVRAVVRGAVRHRLDDAEVDVDWKDAAYPLLRMLGVHPDAATDAVSAARAAELERA